MTDLLPCPFCGVVPTTKDKDNIPSPSGYFYSKEQNRVILRKSE